MPVEGTLAAFTDLDADGRDEGIDVVEALGQIDAGRLGRHQLGAQLGWAIDLVDVENPGCLGIKPLACVLVVARFGPGLLTRRFRGPLTVLRYEAALFALADLGAHFLVLLVRHPDLVLEFLGIGVDPERQNIAATVRFFGQCVFRKRERHARPMPWHYRQRRQ